MTEKGNRFRKHDVASVPGAEDEVQSNIHLAMLGLNHLTASVELRDRAYFGKEDVREFTRRLLEEEDFYEVVVFSTCNRSEIYAVTSRPDGKERQLEKAWAELKKISEDELRNHSYYSRDLDAIAHLFRVASSLDSLVVGENQILGQVKDAYEESCKNGSVDFFLNYVFQACFRVGKRVRAETALNEGAVSISYAAVELAKKVLGQDLRARTVGVVGSGEMGELTAFHLQRAGADRFVFFNRSLNSAERLAARFGGEINTLDSLPDKLHLCDIVVACTAATRAVIFKDQVEKAARMRNGRPIFFIDIAAPRDIETSVQDVKNTFLFTIDDLKKVVGENLALRKEAASAAEAIVHEELENAKAWQVQLGLTPVIQKLRHKFEAMLATELEKRGRNKPEAVRKELEAMGRCLLGKFLHISISGLKKLGQEGGSGKASRYAKQIFMLSDTD